MDNDNDDGDDNNGDDDDDRIVQINNVTWSLVDWWVHF